MPVSLEQQARACELARDIIIGKASMPRNSDERHEIANHLDEAQDTLVRKAIAGRDLVADRARQVTA